jgi:hypothetical protein
MSGHKIQASKNFQRPLALLNLLAYVKPAVFLALRWRHHKPFMEATHKRTVREFHDCSPRLKGGATRLRVRATTDGARCPVPEPRQSGQADESYNLFIAVQKTKSKADGYAIGADRRLRFTSPRLCYFTTCGAQHVRSPFGEDFPSGIPREPHVTISLRLSHGSWAGFPSPHSGHHQTPSPGLAGSSR